MDAHTKDKGGDPELMDRTAFYAFYLRQRAERAAAQGTTTPAQPPPQPEPIPVPEPPPAPRREGRARAFFWSFINCALLSLILGRGVWWRAFIFFCIFNSARAVQFLSSFIKLANHNRGVQQADAKGWNVVVRLMALYIFSLFPSWRIDTLDEGGPAVVIPPEED